MRLTIIENRELEENRITTSEMGMDKALANAAKLLRMAMSEPTFNLTLLINDGQTTMKLER